MANVASNVVGPVTLLNQGNQVVNQPSLNLATLPPAVATLLNYFPSLYYQTNLLTELANAASLNQAVAALAQLSPVQVYELYFVLAQADMPAETKLQYLINVANGTASTLQDNPLMANEKATYERQFTVQTTTVDVQESQLVTCPRCKGKKATFNAEFVRSGDEAQVISYICVLCGYKWQL